MNCPNCGTSNLDNATICANCGRPLNASYTPPPPPPPPASSTSYLPPSGSGAAPGPTIPNYLVQSIVVTLCCCLPLGIVAIIFSAQVNQKLAAGDIAGAQEASRQAKRFAWIGFGCGVAVAVLYAVLMGLGFAGAIFENMGR